MSRYLLLFLSLLFAREATSANVGLLVMATGKYITFVDPLITSARAHFCKEHKVTYFVFTDNPPPSTEDVVFLPQKKLGWPFDTMMRYHAYYTHKDAWQEMDYLFACDADMLFVGDIGSEILGERVATQHPGFVGRRGTYDMNPSSRAYIAPSEGKMYFAGGFYGGSRQEMIQIFETLISNVNDDLSRNVIALWHDESHWNRYCIDHEPTCVLTPSYCYPEGWNLPYTPRLIARNKQHALMRGD